MWISAACILTFLSWQQSHLRFLKRENHDLRVRMQKLEGTIGRNQNEPQTSSGSDERLRNQSGELAALRAEIVRLRLAVARDSAHQEQQAAAEPQYTSEASPVTEVEVLAFLQRPASEQGRLLGTLRRGRMTGKIEPRDETTPDNETIPNKALAAMVREKLEDLESNPAAFAEFQTSFIKEAIGLDDEKKTSQIREILKRTYEQAVANGLDAAMRPEQDVESWALRRDALDRPATRQVEALLTDEERARFGRAFLGIMGIDLGLGDGARHRFVTVDGGVIFPSEQP
jgi:hypothetical protein